MRIPSSSPVVLLLVAAAALSAGCQHANAQTSAPAAAASTSAPAAAALDTPSLVTKVKASVVNITVEHESRRTAMSPFEFFFRGMPDGMAPTPRKDRALGSGFIFDDRGHVLTNAHVIGKAETVTVKLADERELRAKVKGRDERLDIAVLQLEGGGSLPYVTFGSSDALLVGEPVVAIGNPFGLGHTVTTGIVSAKGRAIGAGPYDDFLQTDASINPGNSGGPLFDSHGRVIGMNTAINPAGQGIGFAIPSDEILRVLPQLVAEGRIERARLGVQVQDVDQKLASALGLPDTGGALVGDVEKGSPADKAGLASGDVITHVDGAVIAHARDLSRTIAHRKPGSRVDLVVRRGRETKTVRADLAKLEESKREASASAPSTAGDGALGLQVEDAEGGGALVRRVAPSSPASDTLRPGDVIVEVDRKPVASAADLRRAVGEATAGKPLLLRIKRGGGAHYVAIERR